MKLIPLTQNKFAQVDDEDYDYLNQFKWYAFKVKHTFYAIRAIRLLTGKQKQIFMHRVIMNTPDDMEVDHKDHNGCNNQKDNIRNCTHFQNIGNKKKGINCSSKYKGVTWCKNDKCWQASIQIDGKSIYLGRFKIEIEAALAYNKAAKFYFGDFANPNIILRKVIC